jgi:hypothetical protein
MARKKQYRHKIDLDGRPFEIWQEDGKVKQSGRFALPEVLESFENTNHGRREAGAFIAGMLRAQRIIKGEVE